MDALGINVFNIIVYTLLFVILYFVLKRNLSGPLMNFLDKRAKEVEEVRTGKQQLAETRAELNERTEKLEQELREEFKEDREKILAEAREEKKRIIAAAKEEAEAIVAKGNVRLDNERKQHEEQLEARVDQTVRKVMKEVYLTEKASIDRELIRKALKELS